MYQDDKKIWKLDARDEARMSNIYLHLWSEKGEMGGPQLWFEVVQKFIASKGYEIKEKATPEVGD